MRIAAPMLMYMVPSLDWLRATYPNDTVAMQRNLTPSR
jgi:hypothetical protein